MTVDIEDQIASYAGWLEDQLGVALRDAGDVTDHAVAARHDDALDPWSDASEATASGGSRRRLARLGAVAAVLVGVVATAAVTGRDRSAPGDDGVPGRAQGVAATVEWYEAPGGGGTISDSLLLCRARPAGGPCTSVVGERRVAYGDGAVVTTELGPAPSAAWQALVQVGRAATIGARAGWIALDGSVGFEPEPDLRVIVTGAGAEVIAASVAATSAEVRLPLLFGEAVATDADLPADSVAARYYAAYLDTSGDRPCVRGIGIPWNWNSGEACLPAPADALSVAIATPSPLGTIIVATAPAGTTRFEARTPAGDAADLAVTDASEAGLTLAFGVLGAMAPTELVAFDAEGEPFATTEVTSTGGAQVGYVPGTGPDATTLLLPDAAVQPAYVQSEPALAHRTRGVVRAPSGATFTVNVFEAFGGVQAEAEERVVGGLTWSTQLEDRNRTYVSVGECAMFAINAGEGAAAWSDETLDLLAGLSLGDAAVIDLPDGWSTLDLGTVGVWYLMSFDPGAGATDVTLTQMPGSTAGPILADFPGHPIEAVTFRDGPAWWVTLDDGWTVLVWATDAGAFSLTSEDLSLDELAVVVDGLTETTRDEWQRRYSAIDGGASTTTPSPNCAVPPLEQR